MDITNGLWPPDNFEYTLNGRTRRLLYYLADGVYPKFPIFARPFPRATSNTLKKCTYNRLQEALRKDVERLYGVMTARFHILLHPAKYHSVDRIIRTAKAVAILHNMIVINRRDGYISRLRMGDLYGQAGATASVMMAAAQAEAEAAEAAEAAGSDSLSAFSWSSSSSSSSSSSGTAGSGSSVGAGGGAGAVGDGTAAAAGVSGRAGGIAAGGGGASAAGGAACPPDGTGGGAGTAGAGTGAGGGNGAQGNGRVAPTWRTDDIRRQSALTSPIEHERLRADLMAHVWENKAEALAPFLHRRHALVYM